MSHLALRSLEFVSSDIDDTGVATVRFRPRRPLGFQAGQHGLWLVPGGGVKPFSIASAPQEPVVTIGTSLSSRSRFKRALSRLVPGARVRLLGPLGAFTVDPAVDSVVMLAQGMGVTPFRAMLREAAIAGAGPECTLVHVGHRHPFRADTEPGAAHASYPTSREAFAGAVREVAAERPKASFMVSGSAAFVTSTVALLRDNAVAGTQIRRDKFYGYAPESVGRLSAAGGTAIREGGRA